MSTELNKVDQRIKQMMLQYPSLYPNRIKCLRQLFLTTGNGYEWDDNGCLVLASSRRPHRPADTAAGLPSPPADGKMQYDDLDELLNLIEKLYGPASDVQHIAYQKLTYEKERLDRQFRETHIDLLCQFHDTWDNFTFPDLKQFDPDWSAFRDAPYGNIDADWLCVMEETVSKIKYAFNLIWSLHLDNPPRGEKMPEPSMFSRMPERFQKTYTAICEIEDKLEAQSKSKARAKEHWDSIKDSILFKE